MCLGWELEKKGGGVGEGGGQRTAAGGKEETM